MYLIDKMGRRPLLLIGTAGVAISLLLCSYGFNQATYQLTEEKVSGFTFEDSEKLTPFVNKLYTNDVEFKNDLKAALGNKIYSKNDGAILEAATTINATLVLLEFLVL